MPTPSADAKVWASRGERSPPAPALERQARAEPPSSHDRLETLLLPCLSYRAYGSGRGVGRLLTSVSTGGNKSARVAVDGVTTPVRCRSCTCECGICCPLQRHSDRQSDTRAGAGLGGTATRQMAVGLLSTSRLAKYPL